MTQDSDNEDNEALKQVPFATDHVRNTAFGIGKADSPVADVEDAWLDSGSVLAASACGSDSSSTATLKPQSDAVGLCGGGGGHGEQKRECCEEAEVVEGSKGARGAREAESTWWVVGATLVAVAASVAVVVAARR